MTDRTLNWGETPTDAVYATGDDDPAGGGNFVVVEDLAAGVRLLEYDATTGGLVARADVDATDQTIDAGEYLQNGEPLEAGADVSTAYYHGGLG